MSCMVCFMFLLQLLVVAAIILRFKLYCKFYCKFYCNCDPSFNANVIQVKSRVYFNCVYSVRSGCVKQRWWWNACSSSAGKNITCVLGHRSHRRHHLHHHHHHYWVEDSQRTLLKWWQSVDNLCGYRHRDNLWQNNRTMRMFSHLVVNIDEKNMFHVFFTKV